MEANRVFQIGLFEYATIIKLVESRAQSEINLLQSLYDHCKNRKITQVHLFDIPQYARYALRKDGIEARKPL